VLPFGVASKKRNGGKGQLTTQILVQIRDELTPTREELGARLDQTNERLDAYALHFQRVR
jgi:hypothetical protein